MQHPTASREDWLAARKALLAREKAHTRERDALAEARRDLPWVRIEKDYRFEGPDGTETLADLFAGRPQLAVYHFMYGDDYDAGCRSCSFWADNLDGTDVHLAHRGVSLVLISTAPWPVLASYRERMGWRLKWVSCAGSDFNRDFGVSFAEDELGAATYNYRPGAAGHTELPGFSAFVRGADGAVFHSYSAYGRGLDHFNGAYQLLDLMPKGRDEDGLAYTQEWIRRHDEYTG